MRSSLFHDHDLKLVHLTVYMKLILVLLKNLNSVKSCTPLDIPTLNHGHEMNTIHFI
jgi:hypothetical protein